MGYGIKPDDLSPHHYSGGGKHHLGKHLSGVVGSLVSSADVQPRQATYPPLDYTSLSDFLLRR